MCYSLCRSWAFRQSNSLQTTTVDCMMSFSLVQGKPQDWAEVHDAVHTSRGLKSQHGLCYHQLMLSWIVFCARLVHVTHALCAQGSLARIRGKRPVTKAPFTCRAHDRHICMLGSRSRQTVKPKETLPEVRPTGSMHQLLHHPLCLVISSNRAAALMQQVDQGTASQLAGSSFC